jgi:cell shape-determining protein MreC
MAKALIGYLNSDLQTTTRIANENRRLRERVVDLEAIVLRLQEENDRLTAAQAAALLDITSGALQEMQPV